MDDVDDSEDTDDGGGDVATENEADDDNTPNIYVPIGLLTQCSRLLQNRGIDYEKEQNIFNEYIYIYIYIYVYIYIFIYVFIYIYLYIHSR